MASHAIRDFCGLLPQAQRFFHQPLVVGMTPLHGGCSTLGKEVTTGRERLRAIAAELVKQMRALPSTGTTS
jgi:hypothetical protein